MLGPLNVLTLLRTRGLGVSFVRRVAAITEVNPDSLDELLQLVRESLGDQPRFSAPTAEELAVGHERALALVEKTETLGLATLVPMGRGFPLRVGDIPNAPVLLFAKGDISCLSRDCLVAVVGTRKPTDFGRDKAREIGHTLAENGVVVVSGLALGCDGAAHHGAVSSHGASVAVLAHGLDTLYPSSHRGLAERILANGGCLISEYPPGERPHPQYFVQRDRLQSGLSHAVVVVETDVRGGTMHTVKAAVDQRRPLFCLAHPRQFLTSETSRGNRRLISEGKASGFDGAAELMLHLRQVCAGNMRAPADCSEQPRPLEDGGDMGSHPNDPSIRPQIDDQLRLSL
jgi:DNA processing protein